MAARYRLAASCLAVACAGTPKEQAPPRFERRPEHRPEVIEWADVRRDIEAHICMRRFEVEGHAPFEEPVYGPRSVCNLPPPSTLVERVVEQAYERAGPMLSAMRHEWVDQAIASLSQPDAESRLVAARAAYLQPRFLNELLLQLSVAMRSEGVACPSCPTAESPASRTIAWREFEAYFAAYLWPDPVKTAASGESRVSMNICIEKHGVDDLPSPDSVLRELGFLTAFYTQLVRERASDVFAQLPRDSDFKALTTDDERTRWLRREIGRRIAADAEVRRDVCETIERFRISTGVSVSDCAATQQAG